MKRSVLCGMALPVAGSALAVGHAGVKFEGTVEPVALLGHDGKPEWEAHGDGLTITMPKKLPTDYAHGLKITFEGGLK